MDWCLRKRNYSFFRSEFALAEILLGGGGDHSDKSKL